MLKYLMKLRRKKAFTLVELLIVVGILAILMVCIAAFSGPVQEMIKDTNASTDALAANKIMGDYIENRLAFASSIHIVYNVDALDHNNPLISEVNGGNPQGGYAKVQTWLNNDPVASSAMAGVLVIRYEEDTVDPEKSTYKLYDVPFAHSGVTPSASQYLSYVSDGAGGISNPVFPDHFYSNSQNLIVAPTDVRTNKVKNALYMTVDIIPYDFDEEYLVRNASGDLTAESLYLSPDTLSDYYADPTSIERLSDQRSGAIESVSFELKNIRTKAGNWTALDAASATGSDILIFYYTKHFG